MPGSPSIRSTAPECRLPRRSSSPISFVSASRSRTAITPGVYRQAQVYARHSIRFTGLLFNRRVSARQVAGERAVSEPPPMIEPEVEIHRCIDEGEMTKCLREIPQLLSGTADFLRIESDMIRVGVHLRERQGRFLQPSGARERVDVPERAQREGALVAAQAVRGQARVVP